MVSSNGAAAAGQPAGLGAIEAEMPELTCLLRGLVEHVPVPLWIYDSNDQVVYNNVAGIDWGSGGCIVGKTIDNFSPQVREMLRQGLLHCRETGEPDHREDWVSSTVLGRSYLQFQFVPLPGELVACVPRNLTERKFTEEALQASEERSRFFAEMLEAALVPFATAGTDGRLEMANAAFCQLTGFSEDELRRVSFFEELTDAADLEREQHILRQLAATGLPAQYEKHIPRADASTVPVEVFIQQTAAGETEHQRYFFFVTDITERAAAQRALRLSEERLALALAGAADGIWDYDHRTRCIYRSRHMLELLGYGPDEIAPTLEAWLQIVHPNDAARLREAWEAHCAGLTDSYNVESRVRAKSGEYLCIHDRGKVVQRGPNGEPLRAAGTYTDVTEARRIHEQLQREQKEQTLTMLAGGIAHDFNNILVGILGTATLLREMLPPGDPAAELCAPLATSAQRMAELTSKLLAYARGQAFLPQTVDPGLLAREALAMVRTSIPPHIELAADLPGGLWPVLTDGSQLVQVLLNLLVNAREAIGGEPGRITLSAENAVFHQPWCDIHGTEHAAGEYIRLSVSDTGCGMDESTLHAIFEPFFSTKARGRGLGLAAATGIISQHGGAIIVHSQPGSGSRFEILLPRDDNGALSLEFAATPASDAAQGETVLIVDDDETVLLVLRLMLERLGYRVLAAGNAADCLALYAAHQEQVALAILDIHLEHANGQEVLRQLRQNRPKLPAIICSGFSEDIALQPATLDQRTTFVQKPYDISDLARRIRQLLPGQ